MGSNGRFGNADSAQTGQNVDASNGRHANDRKTPPLFTRHLKEIEGRFVRRGDEADYRGVEPIIFHKEERAPDAVGPFA